MHARGFGFVETVDRRLADVFVPPALLAASRVIDGDLAAAAYVTDARGRLTATALALLARRRTRVFGVVDGDRLLPDPFVSPRAFPLLRPRPAERVAVVATLDPAGRARVLREVGTPGSAEAATAQALERADLGRWADDDLAAEAVDDETLPRRDLTALLAFSVDDPSTRDLDDALSVEPDAGGLIRLYVHVADVASAVPEGGCLDRRALALGASLYLPDRVVGMFPTAAVTDRCALVPDERRRALTVVLDVDSEGRVVASDVLASWVRSRARLSYDDVQAVMTGQASGAERGWAPDLTAAVTLLDVVTTRLATARRTRHGFLGEGVSDRDEGHLARASVEEAMLAANAALALWLSHRGAKTLYRARPEPDDGLAALVTAYAESMGVEPHLPEDASWTALEAVSDLLAHRGVAARDVADVVLRAMPRAHYVPAPAAHSSLGVPAYVHGTSPLRRRADVEVQRTVVSLLARRRARARTEADCAAADESLRRAARVADVARQLTLAARLRHDPTWTARARVVRVSTRGLYVRVLDHLVSGWVAATQLGGPRATLEGSALVCGSRSYVSGQVVRVRIARTDPRSGTLDFALAE